MEEKFDQNDAIGRLIREEGLLTTSPDFTGRVMHLVEENTQKVGTEYKPLLSRRAWLIIALILAVMMALCIVEVASGNPGQLIYGEKLKSISDFIAGIHIPLNISAGALMLVTCSMASMGLLLVADYFLHKRIVDMLN